MVMKTYLVTGGAGFIGSAIGRKLLNRGDKVVVIDNLKTGMPQNVPPGAEFIHADIRNRDALSALNRFHYDAVLHLAAQSSGEISHDDPDYDLDSNARGTLNLLQWSQEKGIRRFLNASSMGVYGQVTEKQCPVKEAVFLQPLSFYGVSKLAAECYCNYFMAKGMSITSFRMFNVYGPGQNLGNMKQGMVSIYLKFMLDGQPIIVKGSKDRFRDFIYVDDVVEAWVRAIDAPATYGKVFNLGTGKKTTVVQLLTAMKEAFGRPEYPIEYAANTPGDQFGIFADIAAIEQDLGWKPATSLQLGLVKFVEWAKGTSHA